MILFQFIWERYGGGRWMGHGPGRHHRQHRRVAAERRRQRQAKALKKLATVRPASLTSYQACLSYFIISSPP